MTEQEILWERFVTYKGKTFGVMDEIVLPFIVKASLEIMDTIDPTTLVDTVQELGDVVARMVDEDLLPVDFEWHNLVAR